MLGINQFSAQAKQGNNAVAKLGNALVPAYFDCSQIRALGIDKQETCGLVRSRSTAAKRSAAHLALPAALPSLSSNCWRPPLWHHGVDLVTGTESSPHITQSETFTTANPDNPNEIVVAYNDSRGVFSNPINISGASVSTDGGNTFTRLTRSNGQSPFSNTFGDPVILFNRPSGTWYSVWLDAACGGQGLGEYKSTTPANPDSWTHFCIHNGFSDDRESGWADNNPSSPFYGRMYVSFNDFGRGGGALFVRYSKTMD